ncbi:MAG: hypothetical protein U5R14_05895 [Gemmatimonadota bacterium]|nr:hypothetical protein [Gemmatimonadota bacterium]
MDDDLVDGEQETTLTVSVDASSDDAFTGLADQTASVTTTDDDDVAGFTLADTTGLTVSEGRRRRTRSRWCWTHSLTSDVVLTVTSGDTGEATVSPASLTFTSGRLGRYRSR